MNGILLVNKPKDWTSFDVVAVVRRMTGIRKIGHGGTLDPMAEGVLPVFIGNTTKAIDCSPDTEKIYIAAFRLGIVTDTQDCSGEVLERHPVSVSKEQLETVINTFTGEIAQIPPMYSAVKHNGQPLYKLARQGIEIERKPRTITIRSLRLLTFDGVNGTMEIECSKGTYVRTLIHDIGQQLKTGAAMTALTRTKSHGYTIDRCHTIEKLRTLTKEELKLLLLPVSTLFENHSTLTLNEQQTKLFKNGLLPNHIETPALKGPVLFMAFDGETLGVGEMRENGLFIKKRLYGG